MDDAKRMPFGKTMRVGNFSVLKYNKTLSKSQIASLRQESGLSKENWKKVERVGMPYIKVSAISGIWAVEFAEPSTMFLFLDTRDYENEKDKIGLFNLFTQWFADTSVMGDKEFIRAKTDAITAFLSRQKVVNDEKSEEKAIKSIKEGMEIVETTNKMLNEGTEE